MPNLMIPLYLQLDEDIMMFTLMYIDNLIVVVNH